MRRINRLWGVGAILLVTQWGFAGVHVWATALMAAAIFAVTALALLRDNLREGAGRQRRAGFVWWQAPYLLPCGLALLAAAFLQTIPLPWGVLEAVSPKTAELVGHAFRASGGTPPDWASLSLDPAATRAGILRLGAYLAALWLVLSGGSSKRRLRGLATWIVVLGLFQVYYGMVQTYGGEGRIWWWAKEYYRGFVTGTYINKNSLGGFLEMATPMAFGLALAFWGLPDSLRRSRGEQAMTQEQETGASEVQRVKKRKRRSGESASPERRRQDDNRPNWALRAKNALFALEDRAVAIVFLVLGVNLGVGLLLTSSRGAILALAAGALVMGGLFAFKRHYRRVGAAVLCCCLVVFVYALSVGMERTTERFAHMDYGLEDRWELTKASVPIVADFPFLGTGVGTFEHVFTSYAPPERGTRVFTYAHNDWLQAAVEMGLLGAGICVIGFGLFLVYAVRKWFQRRHPLAVGLGAGAIAAVVAIGVHSLVDFNMHMPANALTLAIIAGIGLRALTYREKVSG